MSWDCIHYFFPYTAHLKLILSITSLPTNCLMPSLTVISDLSSPEMSKMETHRKAGLGSFLLTFHDSCNQLWSYRHRNPRSWAQGNTKTWQTMVGGAMDTNAIMVLPLSWKYLVSVLHKAVRKSGACFLLGRKYSESSWRQQELVVRKASFRHRSWAEVERVWSCRRDGNKWEKQG